MLGRIWALVVKEMIQFWRDRLMAPLIVLGPLVELSLVAWATSAPVSNLPTAIVDLDRSQESRAVTTALQNTGTFEFTRYLSSEDEAGAMVADGTVVVAVLLPEDFADRLASPSGQPAEMALILDGADPMAARAALESAQGAVDQVSQEVLTRWNGGRPPPTSLVTPTVRVRYNEEMKKSVFTLPAELGMILFAIALIVASLSIAREKEQGTLEQVLVTPVRYIELVLAKAIPPLILSFTGFTLMLLVSIHFFGVPMRGSWPLLMAVSLFFLLVELGIGLTASAFSNSQMQAAMLVFGWVMIEFLFTGYGVPVENMPWLMQKLANVFPIYHYMAIFRSILLKGVGIQAIWPHLVAGLILGVFINILTVVSLSRQKWD